MYEQFIKERHYLHNVSSRTIEWYEDAFKWMRRFPLPQDGMNSMVVAMRQKDLSPDARASQRDGESVSLGLDGWRP
jgi:hypothetical protein